MELYLSNAMYKDMSTLTEVNIEDEKYKTETSQRSQLPSNYAKEDETCRSVFSKYNKYKSRRIINYEHLLQFTIYTFFLHLPIRTIIIGDLISFSSFYFVM